MQQIHYIYNRRSRSDEETERARAAAAVCVPFALQPERIRFPVILRTFPLMSLVAAEVVAPGSQSERAAEEKRNQHCLDFTDMSYLTL